jgi:hypothetical protein
MRKKRQDGAAEIAINTTPRKRVVKRVATDTSKKETRIESSEPRIPEAPVASSIGASNKGVSLRTVMVIVLGALIIGGSGTYLALRGGEPASPSQEPYVVPPLSQGYMNEKHRFSVTMPEGFTARESSADGIDTIVFENGKAEGIQIVISPYDDVPQLTKAMILADIPDMAVTDEQPVEIGSNHTGIAFKSDNPAFDGASREVWFVFRGELYQISTYERFDPLLIAMFGTWQFDATDAAAAASE